MTQGFYEILSNVTIAKDIYEMVLGGDTSAITAPGQFINIKVEGFYICIILLELLKQLPTSKPVKLYASTNLSQS